MHPDNDYSLLEQLDFKPKYDVVEDTHLPFSVCGKLYFKQLNFNKKLFNDRLWHIIAQKLKVNLLYLCKLRIFTENFERKTLKTPYNHQMLQ